MKPYGLARKRLGVGVVKGVVNRRLTVMLMFDWECSR
jgi:hypothetical protein